MLSLGTVISSPAVLFHILFPGLWMHAIVCVCEHPLAGLVFNVSRTSAFLMKVEDTDTLDCCVRNGGLEFEEDDVDDGHVCWLRWCSFTDTPEGGFVIAVRSPRREDGVCARTYSR